jgi:hypothetical protein
LYEALPVNRLPINPLLCRNPGPGTGLAQGDNIVPIPGTKRRIYLEENIGALNVKLTAEELSQINEALPKGITAGLRYPEQAMKALGL